VVSWKCGVCFTSCHGQEASLEVFLVGCDGTTADEGFPQVLEHLQEGHPRFHLRRWSAGTQMRTQDALTQAQTPVKPVAAVQRQRHGGVFPCALDRAGLLERPDERPQLPGIETTPGNAVAQPYARGSSATPPTGAFFASDPPGADADVRGRVMPPDVAVADQCPHCPAKRTTQKRQASQKDMDLRLRPEEALHPRRLQAKPVGARSKTTGINSIGGG